MLYAKKANVIKMARVCKIKTFGLLLSTFSLKGFLKVENQQKDTPFHLLEHLCEINQFSHAKYKGTNAPSLWHKQKSTRQTLSFHVADFLLGNPAKHGKRKFTYI